MKFPCLFQELLKPCRKLIHMIHPFFKNETGSLSFYSDPFIPVSIDSYQISIILSLPYFNISVQNIMFLFFYLYCFFCVCLSNNSFNSLLSSQKMGVFCFFRQKTPILCFLNIQAAFVRPGHSGQTGTAARNTRRPPYSYTRITEDISFTIDIPPNTAKASLRCFSCTDSVITTISATFPVLCF